MEITQSPKFGDIFYANLIGGEHIQSGIRPVVIGHSGQCDLYNNPQNSGFVPYLNHFKGQERCAICALKNNHRGWVSRFADTLE